MSRSPKIRSDYHDLCLEHQAQPLHRAMHPMVLLGLGFCLGLSLIFAFDLTSMPTQLEEEQPTVAYQQVNAVIFEEKSPTANV